MELAARPITIHRIAVRSYAYPELTLEIDCGSGTYVRSLGRDVAAVVGHVGGHVGAGSDADRRFLHRRRGRPGPCLTPDNWLSHVQPPLRAVEYLPRVQLSATDADRIRNGLTIEQSGGPGMMDGLEGAAEVAAISPDGQLIGLLTPHCRQRVAHPTKLANRPVARLDKCPGSPKLGGMVVRPRFCGASRFGPALCATSQAVVQQEVTRE